ncbi:ABC transporter permease [Nocardia uniformis]|uniref:ABC transporter permease n=1 Tax=Nocardia uniformis TaxID=53432 RepID=A0A849BX54_9NOCA|nr:ABC transporter permease [Nocardia uniformis]NNH69758.1 ABC transporter permease [Nocardia uniformis]
MIRTVPAAVVRAGTSEVRKVTSLRMNWMTATALVVIGAIVFSVAGFTVEAALGSDAEDGFLTAGGALAAAVLILAAAIVLAGVFGAVAAGSEYRYRTLPVSSLFTPDRNLLLGAKMVVAAVFTLLTVLTLEVLGIGAFLLFGRDRIQIEGSFYALLGGVLLAAVCWSLIGAALGFVLRSPTQAVAVLIGWSILEPLVWVTADALGIPGVATILPASATVGTATVGSFPDAAFIAPTPAAIVVLLVWTTGLVTAAWWLLREREL